MTHRLATPLHAAVIALAMVALSACGGGGGHTVPVGVPSGPSPVPSGANALSFRVLIGTANAASTSGHARTQDVSAATSGVLVSVYTTAAMTTPISQTAVDVSPGSAACNGVTTTPRTCIATVSLPSSTASNLGPYWFGISTYASAPVSGAFTTAVIGTSTIANVTLTAGGSNQISAIIAGIVSSSNVTS